MLQHDASGFLIGQVLTLSQDLAATQSRNLSELRSVRTQVTAIARAIGARVGSAPSRPTASAPAGGSVSASRGMQIAAVPRGRGAQAVREIAAAAALAVATRPAATRLRDSRGRFVSGAGAAAAAVDLPRAAVPSRGGAGRQAAAEASPIITRRDPATGRFVKMRRNEVTGEYEAITPAKPRDAGSGSDGGARNPSAMAGVVSGAAGAVRDVAVNATEGVDPTIQALKEVREVFSPIGRGLSAAWNAVAQRRKEGRRERWYARIMRALQRRGDATSNTNIIGGGSGDAGSDAGGLLSLMKKPGLGALGRLIPGRLLSRLPLLGAALGAGTALWNALKPDDASKTPEQNHTDRYRAVGGGTGATVGALAGGALGSIAGPVGTVIGATAGSVAGDYLGKKSGELLSKVVPDGAVTDAIKSARDAVAASVPDGIKNLAVGGARAAALLKTAMAGGILNPMKLANFMGQMSHESMGFKRLEENLNYKPQGLLKTFRKYFKDEADAEAVAKAGPEAVANRVYGGRMGNKAAGDGWKYRGRGYVHLTGRDNYAAASKDLGIDLVNNPDLAADPDVAAKIAVWYWNKRVAAKGADRDVLAATRAINGGTNGLADRQARAAAYAAAFSGPAGVTAAQAVPAPVSLPAAVPSRLPAMPEVRLTVPLTKQPDPVVRVSVNDPIGQNVPDRGLAHVVTGGLGG